MLRCTIYKKNTPVLLLIAGITMLSLINIIAYFFKNHERYNYSLWIAYDESYPMSEIRGDFLSDKEKYYFYAQSSPSTWGRKGSLMSFDNQRLPSGMTLSWYSQKEEHLWNEEITWDPAFYEVFKSINIKDQFSYFAHNQSFMSDLNFVIHLSPYGVVTIWLAGGEAQYLIKQHIPNNSINMVNQELSHLKDSVEKFPWKLELNAPYSFRTIKAQFMNGESFYINPEMGIRALPIELMMTINIGPDKFERYSIQFDKEELKQLFKNALPLKEDDFFTLAFNFSLKDEQKKLIVTLLKNNLPVKKELSIEASWLNQYVEEPCIYDDPQLLMKEGDFTDGSDLKEGEGDEMFVIKSSGGVISDYAYRIVRENDQHYYYGKTNDKGETVRVRAPLGVKLSLYNDKRGEPCVPDQVK